MQRRVDSTVQDYKKLIAIMGFKYPNGMPFCREAAMMFFSNTEHVDALNSMFKSFPKKENVQIITIIKH